MNNPENCLFGSASSFASGIGFTLSVGTVEGCFVAAQLKKISGKNKRKITFILTQKAVKIRPGVKDTSWPG